MGSSEGERGAAAVEFAVLFPVVIVILGVIAVFINWAVVALNVNSITGEIARAAIVSADVRSAEAVSEFDGVVNRHTSEAQRENYAYTVEYVDANGEESAALEAEDAEDAQFVRVEVSAKVRSGPLALMIDDISAKVVGRVER